MKYKYELWYDFYDGTQDDRNKCQKKIKTFIDKRVAWRELKKLNAKCEFHDPYFLKRVEVL